MLTSFKTMNFFRTEVHIDLESLQYNLLYIKKKAPLSKILAMVKSNAYGHGAIEISKVLTQQVNVLGVSSLQEALELYFNKVNSRLVIWGGFLNEKELTTIAQFGFETVVHSFHQLSILESLVLTKPLKVWLKIDTGMHRLGFELPQVIDVYNNLMVNKNVSKPLYLMTHFSDADILANPKTLKQISIFESITANWIGEKGIANSASILNWPKTYLEWVRPGILLYGISPVYSISSQKLGISPVMTLTSKIISLKEIKKGESIGYGSSWVCPQNTLMGIVSIGYGDGYPRHIKEGTLVLVNGIYCPIIGRVSMDYLTIDLSKVAGAKVGDLVILWGKDLPIEDIAEKAGTSPYELCCQLTQRVKFKFYSKSSELKKNLHFKNKPMEVSYV